MSPTHPSVPTRFYVPKPSVVSTILTGLDEVERPEHDCLGPVGLGESAPGTSRFDIVLAGVGPADLKDAEDDIVLGRRLKEQDKRNHHLLFAPIASVVDPERIRCPVAVTSLQAVGDPDDLLALLTASLSPVLPGPSGTSQLALTRRDGTPLRMTPRRQTDATSVPADHQ